MRWQFDADIGKKFETYFNGPIDAIQNHVEGHLLACDCSPVDESCCPLCQSRESVLRNNELISQVLAFATVNFEIEKQLILPIPTVIGKQLTTGGKIIQC